MSLQERKGIMTMSVNIIVFVVYSIIFNAKYETWGLELDDIFRFWAVFFVGIVIVGVVAQIVSMILLAIVNEVIGEIKGEKEEAIDFEDERDKLIQLKASQNSMIVFIVGLLLAFVSQLFNISNHYFFIILFGMGFLSSLLSDLLTMYYYRKGV